MCSSFLGKIRECNRHSDMKQNAMNIMQNRRRGVIRHALLTLDIERL